MSLFSKEDIRVGIAPIGWTNDDMPDLGKDITFGQAVSEMALAGFEGTEVGGAYPTDATILKRELDRRGLRIASKWFSSELLIKPYDYVETEFCATLDYLQVLGATRVNVCDISYSSFNHWDKLMYGESYAMSDLDWEMMTTGLNKLGAIAQDRGIKLCFHHHIGAAIESEEETVRLLENTDPDKVYLCYDTGHFLGAKTNPIPILKKYCHRVGHVHLKDYRKNIFDKIVSEGKCFRDGVLAGVFTVPGNGDFDFTPVFEILAENHYQGWFLVEAEQDPAKANPLDYAKIARTYIHQKTGV